MNNGLRRSVKEALKKLDEADLAVKAIEKHLVFSGFRGDEPCVSACNGGEIILEYKGFEMSIEEAIERMEEYGYISRSDFPEY